MERNRLAGVRVAVFGMLGLVACSGTSGPANEGSHEASCDSICRFHAECEKMCFPDEDPECDEQENYDAIYGNCNPECLQSESLLDGACADAAVTLAGCFEGRSCEAGLGEACRIEDMRYHELCLEQPGEYVCRNFCVELQMGCIPYELFGFRGDGCEEACKASAADLACLEAHYAFDQCTPGMMFACGAWTEDCATEAASAVDLCEGWQPVTPDPEELSFCGAVAPHQCDCGLWSGEDCVPMATNRCMFLLGRGTACRDATEAFDACMTTIESCNRDKLRDECLPEWDAWTEACKP
jgi:hypothetical protein